MAIAHGATKTAPVSCRTMIDDDIERRTASIGRAHPHVEIKIPRHVHIVDEFPNTVTGKIRKVEMREVTLELLRAELPGN